MNKKREGRFWLHAGAGLVSLFGSLPLLAGEPPLVPIYTIQGRESASPVEGKTVRTRGIVVGDFQGRDRLGGFFIQDPQGDGVEETSDGLFVETNGAAVRAGDLVDVTGQVAERYTQTTLLGTQETPLRVTTIERGRSIRATNVVLPLKSPGDLERFEGMLVTFPQTLTVTEVHDLDRYGEALLSAGGRLFIPTNQLDPNDLIASGTNVSGRENLAAVTAARDANALRTILLDDGCLREFPSPVPYVNRKPGEPLTLRAGSTLEHLTGALSFAFGKYRLQPTEPPRIHYALRPPVPDVRTGAKVTVAAFNLLNYFVTLDDGENDARGADSPSEFQRQRAKVIAAIAAMNADIVGLVEVEKHPAALENLVAGLNDRLGPSVYAAVPDPAGLTVDCDPVIKVALIYKPAAAERVGPSRTTDDPAFANARRPVAQAFRLKDEGGVFTVIVNHFKSKTPHGARGEDEDQGDGQAAFNASRRRQAISLVKFSETLQRAASDPDVLVVGDLNADTQEDPVDLLRRAGFVDEVQRFAKSPEYTYVYFGQAGCLDHGLASTSLSRQVVGAFVWHINADEPFALDYNDDVLDRSTTPDTRRRDKSLYQPDAFRSSDHDPILMGLDLDRGTGQPTRR